jgi:hypothetical protein
MEIDLKVPTYIQFNQLNKKKNKTCKYMSFNRFDICIACIGYLLYHLQIFYEFPFRF